MDPLLNYLSYIILGLNSGIGIAAFNMWQANRTLNDRRNITDKILLRDSLTKNIMEELEKGHTTLHKHKEITEAFDLYKGLCGNGTAEVLYNKYNNLDIKGE